MQSAAILWHISLLVSPQRRALALGMVGLVRIAPVVFFSLLSVIAAPLMMTGVRAPGSESADAGVKAEFTLHAAREGLRFVFRHPLIRSTMLLDFFATFFSSATALLPIYAQDILQVGARGYGWLYAAPAVGAVTMSAAMVPLTDRIERRGPTLLWAVAGYGVATVVFGLS